MMMIDESPEGLLTTICPIQKLTIRKISLVHSWDEFETTGFFFDFSVLFAINLLPTLKIRVFLPKKSIC